MKFVWKHMPLSGGSVAEKAPGGPDIEPGKTTVKEQEADLKGYLDRSEQLPAKEKQEFLDKVKKWDKQENAIEMRRGGMSSAEDDKDPLKKHILLSAAFLERQKNETGKMSFKVDFHGSQTAEYKIGLIHMTGPGVRAVKVLNEFGQVISAKAFRGINPVTKREGFFDEETYRTTGQFRYVPVYTGWSFEVLESQGSNSPAVMRSTLSEHVQKYQMPEAETPPLPTSPSITFSRGKSMAENLAGFEARVGAGAETPVDRQRIVDVALKYCNIPRDEFRTGDVEGGNLACGKVASTILKEAGFVDQVMLGVDQTRDHLLQRGWTMSDEKPEPGDIIIWEPMLKPVSGTIDDAGDGPQYVKGHKHIGIAIGPNMAVSNSSSLRMPRQHPIYNGRGVEAILKPPRIAQQKTVAQRQGGMGEKQPTSKPGESYSAGPNEKLNSSILSKLEKFNPIIQEASEKYGVSANLIRAVIWQESGGNPILASHAGAGGLMQLMPETAKGSGLQNIYEMRQVGGHYEIDPQDDRADPYKNIMAGTKLLSKLLKKYNGNIELALASYNWGSGNVDKFLRGEKGMPKETQGYIVIIPRMYGSLNAGEKGTNKPGEAVA